MLAICRMKRSRNRSRTCLDRLAKRKKQDLLAGARFNQALLAEHELYSTAATGVLLEQELGLQINKLRSGPLGGDQQIGAKITEGDPNFLIFFWDPLESQPHDSDVRVLLRIAISGIRLSKATSFPNKGGAMPPILVHYSVTLDLAGRTDTKGIVKQFLEQANLAEVNKTVETIGSQCVIRFMVEGPETLTELRQAFKYMTKGLFSEATKAALRTLKERPSDLYLEVRARPPLFGLDEEDSLGAH
jgi:methylglyoxal synthase